MAIDTDEEEVELIKEGDRKAKEEAALLLLVCFVLFFLFFYRQRTDRVDMM